MDYLAQLAAKGHTCIATIHAPRTAIWAKFHKVGATFPSLFPSLAQHQSGKDTRPGLAALPGHMQ